MAKYTMAIKTRTDQAGDVIWRTEADGLMEAKNYFVGLKNLPELEFDKMFVVKEVREKKDEQTKI